jgi:uncharacterized membrane protein (UPF0127 family)
VAWAEPGPACADPGDLASIAAARERIADHGASAWPGWTVAPPVLLRSGEVDCLIAHPAPPAGFVPVADGVAQWAGHLIPVPAATTWPVADVWSVAVPARAELQAFLDEHLGAASLEITPGLYERTITHEAFHALQMTLLGGPGGVPDFGAPAGERLRLEDLDRTDGIDRAMREQGRHLAAALAADTAGDAVHAAAAFLAARRAWREAAPAGTAALERQVEFLEGTARYADVLLSLFPPDRAGVRADDAWQGLLAQVRDVPSVESGIRDRYAALGAAQAFVLDRLHPGWKRHAIPGGASLEDLLHAAVEGAAGVPDRLAALPVTTARLDGRRWRLAVADHPDAWSRGLQGVHALGGVDGLLFAFPEDVRAPFWMRGATVPLVIAFFDRDGRWLASHAMPLCEADPCPTYRPPVPYRYALELTPGRVPAPSDGDVLDLNPW